MTTETKQTISKNTPITLQFGILLSIIGGAFYVGSGLQKLETRLVTLERNTRDRWSYGMERELWSEVRRQNPEFSVPDVRRIKSDHSLP